MRVLRNVPGNYRFLGGEDRPFALGAAADVGFDIVHATFDRPLPLERGIQTASQHVASASRPNQALAGFELRIPRALSKPEFDEFNRLYAASLRGIGLATDGLVSAARTNVAPTIGTVAEASLLAFSYTAPTRRDVRAYVLSGAPEARDGSRRDMIRSIVEVLMMRGDQLNCRLNDATAVQFYGERGLEPSFIDDLVASLGDAVIHGFHWFPSLPPIVGLKFEIDLRSVGSEVGLRS